MCRKPASENAPKVELAETDKWLDSFDFEAFTEEVKALGKKLEAQQGEEDVAHLNKIISWSNLCAAVGLLTLGFRINVVTIFCMSMYSFTRWTCIGHHVCHGGYEKCHPNLSRWSRFKFALGSVWRRWNDWFDWMMPEAWNVEHNTRHHYNLSEVTDPDLVENNAGMLRDMPIPTFLKYPLLVLLMASWKWFYYAPNTYKELKLARMRRKGEPIPEGVTPEDSLTVRSLLMGQSPFVTAWEFFSVVAGPYLLIHFFLTPLPWFAIGEYLPGFTGADMYKTAFWNLVLADVMSNVHSFICIVTNHAGDDMYRFRDPCRPYSGSFFLRQILASANYNMGYDLNDIMHGFLNYQVEHHLWPNLSMRSYQKAAPMVQEICKRYGVPYTKHNVFWRLKKTADIMVGNANMRWFPKEFEEHFLLADTKMSARKDE